MIMTRGSYRGCLMVLATRETDETAISITDGDNPTAVGNLEQAA